MVILIFLEDKSRVHHPWQKSQNAQCTKTGIANIISGEKKKKKPGNSELQKIKLHCTKSKG